MAVGFLGGLLGKGGSAIATPLLHAIGVPAIVAVAAPLPAAIPSTLAAAYAYGRAGHIDWRIVRGSIGFGVPATAVGAGLTRWVGGGVLVTATDLMLIALGIRLLLSLRARAHRDQLASVGAGVVSVGSAVGAGPSGARVASVRDVEQEDGPHPSSPKYGGARLAVAAVCVGLLSGLLANSGGFLLAPLYLAVLRLPIKSALANSLAVACVLAVPGTVVHAALGHIDWTLVAVFGATSVPLSFVGARVGLRTDPDRLELLYGATLVTLGCTFLLAG
jgi:uncharacterized membrane protein YfcA